MGIIQGETLLREKRNIFNMVLSETLFSRHNDNEVIDQSVHQSLWCEMNQ